MEEEARGQARTKALSRDEEARMRVGMPRAVPRRFSMNLIMDGTTTAGETAATMNPSMALSR
jgi:hypothetical protein